MKKKDISLAYICAQLYYEQNLSQVEIAEKLSISRPKVSRLLAMAQEIGIVKISVEPPELFDQTTLENQIKEKYGLNHVAVGIPARDTEEEIKRTIGSEFRNRIDQLLHPKMAVGVGQGTTVYEAASMLIKINDVPSGITIIPLMGGLGQSGPAYQINNIVDKFSNALAAESLYLMAPSICDSSEQKESFLESRQVQSVVDKWTGLDMVIFGMGKPLEESEVLYSELPQNYLIEMLKHRSSGDILARFMDPEGNILCEDSESVMMAIPFRQLMGVPERICLAGGIKKTAGIKNVISRGYATSLFTDLYTAQRLIGG